MYASREISLRFEIYCFVDERGRAPVESYIGCLPDAERLKIAAYLHTLGELGYQMRRPFADSLGNKTGLYELRPGRHRVLYFFYLRDKVILLHAFLKKTNKIPEREIEIALHRKEICEVLNKYHILDFTKNE